MQCVYKHVCADGSFQYANSKSIIMCLQKNSTDPFKRDFIFYVYQICSTASVVYGFDFLILIILIFFYRNYSPAFILNLKKRSMGCHMRMLRKFKKGRI